MGLAVFVRKELPLEWVVPKVDFPAVFVLAGSRVKRNGSPERARCNRAVVVSYHNVGSPVVENDTPDIAASQSPLPHAGERNHASPFPSPLVESLWRR